MTDEHLKQLTTLSANYDHITDQLRGVVTKIDELSGVRSELHEIRRLLESRSKLEEKVDELKRATDNNTHIVEERKGMTAELMKRNEALADRLAAMEKERITPIETKIASYETVLFFLKWISGSGLVGVGYAIYRITTGG
jgi:predicted nuclease with TOPRIM domain